MRHPAFPKSVCGVVFQGAASDNCQFSFACNGMMHRPRENAAWARAEVIAARALTGFVMPEVGQATHFHAAGAQPGSVRGAEIVNPKVRHLGSPQGGMPNRLQRLLVSARVLITRKQPRTLSGESPLIPKSLNRNRGQRNLRDPGVIVGNDYGEAGAVGAGSGAGAPPL